MSESDLVQFKLMLPADLKDRVAEVAQQNRRSLSQEIVATLELQYPAPPPDPSNALREIILYIRAKTEAAEQALRNARSTDDPFEIAEHMKIMERSSSEASRMLDQVAYHFSGDRILDEIGKANPENRTKIEQWLAELNAKK